MHTSPLDSLVGAYTCVCPGPVLPGLMAFHKKSRGENINKEKGKNMRRFCLAELTFSGRELCPNRHRINEREREKFSIPILRIDTKNIRRYYNNKRQTAQCYMAEGMTKATSCQEWMMMNQNT